MPPTQVTIDSRKTAVRLQNFSTMEGVAAELRRMVYEDTVLLTALHAAIDTKGGAPAPITNNLALAQVQVSNAMEAGGNTQVHARGPICAGYVIAACDWLDAQAFEEEPAAQPKKNPADQGGVEMGAG